MSEPITPISPKLPPGSDVPSPCFLPSSLPGPETRPPHHLKYYLEDEMTVFLVENRLFKVHRHFLIRESEVFRWMFTCPPRPSGPEGRTDEKAIPLPGVTCREFESLLDFFYEGMHDTSVSQNDLINLLSISTRFDFEKIRQRVISRLSKYWNLDPIEKIVLAEKYDIPDWLAPAYIALCQRPNPLDEEEARKIGWTKTVLVARAREVVRDSCRGSWSPPMAASPVSPFVLPLSPGPARIETYQPYSPSRVARIVDEVFFPPHRDRETPTPDL